MKLLIFILLLGCNKSINKLEYQNKIGEDNYWEYIEKDEADKLRAYLEKKENEHMDLNEKNKDENSQKFKGETPLTLAVKCNSLKVVKFLLDKGVRVDERNSSGKTPLVVAIIDNSKTKGIQGLKRYEIIEKLLRKDANVDARYGIRGNNTLMLAIIKEDVSAVNKILNNDNIDINAKNSFRETALMLAIKSDIIENQKIELLNKILDKKDIQINLQDKQGKSILTHAVIKNDYKIVDMLSNRSDIDTNIIDKRCMMPLDHLNFEDFQIHLAISLIRNGATMNNKTYFYNKARKHYLEEIIRLLIEGKGEISYEKDNKNLLHWSILLFNNNIDISLKLTKYLIKEMKLESNLVKSYLKYAQERNVDIFHLIEILYKEEMSSYLNENVIELENREEKIKDFLFKSLESGSINTFKNLLKMHSNVNIKDAFGSTLLISAVNNEDKNIITLLINYDADVNYRNKEGDTALIIAVRKGNKEIANLLVQAGANINEKDEDGLTPLTIAISKYPEILELFIKLGADVNVKNNDGKTPLMLATIYNNKNSVSLLIQRGSQIDLQDMYGWNALMYSIIYSFEDIAEFLIDKGANVNIKNNKGDTSLLIISYGYLTSFSFNKRNGTFIPRIHIPLYSCKGYTELEVETTRDKISPPLVNNYGYVDEKVLNSLIKAGADINDKNNEGETAIAVAKRCKNKKMVDFLEDRGASQTYQNAELYNLNKMNSIYFEDQEDEKAEALITAVLERDAENVISLIKAGANINYTDGEERTALVHSIEFGYDEIARLLIEYPSLRYKNYNKEKALISAIKYKRKTTIELLIKEEIDINYKDDEGYTPLFLAVFLKDIEIMKILIKAGADVNYKNDLGTTLLMDATFKKSIETVKYLIDAGAKIDEKNSQGKTALLFAIEYGNRDIAKLIIKEEISLLYNNNFEVALISKARKIVKERMYLQVCIYIIKEAIKQNDKKFENTKSEEKTELFKLIKLLPKEVFENILNFL